MTDTQALIGKPFRMEFARKLVNSKRHHLPPHMQVDALDEIERLTTALTDAEAKLAKARGWTAMLYCASGCSCCRDDETWEKASEQLGAMFDIPPYEDASGRNWYEVRDSFRACLAKLGEG